jgi:precorrin-6B methylase 2
MKLRPPAARGERSIAFPPGRLWPHPHPRDRRPLRSRGFGSQRTAVRKVLVQGARLSILTIPGVEPTPFSLFVARTMRRPAEDGFAVDAGAGGGILAIALARMGVCEVVGVERSALACEVFQENVRRNGVGDRVRVVHGDIADYDPPHRVDLVVANPPTLPERGELPAFVQGGGADGMVFLETLLGSSKRWLEDDGSLQLVVSSLVDPARLAELMRDWRLDATDTQLVRLRSFYRTAYGTGSDGSLRLPGDPSGRVFRHRERITVYRATSAVECAPERAAVAACKRWRPAFAS